MTNDEEVCIPISLYWGRQDRLGSSFIPETFFSPLPNCDLVAKLLIQRPNLKWKLFGWRPNLEWQTLCSHKNHEWKRLPNYFGSRDQGSAHSFRHSYLKKESRKLEDQGGFHLVDLIITELKDHMICYKLEGSHWWKIYL